MTHVDRVERIFRILCNADPAWGNDHHARLLKAANSIAAMDPPPEWTACAERMPADGEHVLIYEAGEIGAGPEVSVYHAGRWWGKILAPTHWQPLGPVPGEHR